MSDTPMTDSELISAEADMRSYEFVDFKFAQKLERQLNAANARITTLQTQLDQRWEVMRELEAECGTNDVAKAVKYIKGLKASGNKMFGMLIDEGFRQSDLDFWNKTQGQQ